MFRNPLTDAIVVIVILLLFFGPKRLPGLGRSIGEGIKEFKDGITSGSDGEREQLPEGEKSEQAREPAEAGSDRSA
jgi:sec-independent protein translocase protein TatA